jgi:hypothetical protein
MTAREQSLADSADDRGRPTATDAAVVRNDESFRITVSRIPAFVCTLTASGAIEFVNDLKTTQRYLNVTDEDTPDDA